MTTDKTTLEYSSQGTLRNNYFFINDNWYANIIGGGDDDDRWLRWLLFI